MTATSTHLLRHVRQLAAVHTFEQWTDRQLLERFAAGRDEPTFTLLVRRHGPMVLGLCRRILGHEQDAEDAFQAAFLLLARKAASIRQADVGGWLYRVAYHLAVRVRAQTVKRQQRDPRGGAMSSMDPVREATWNEMRQVVEDELQRLPDDLRSALVLCHLEGKTQEEAARLLGWSKGTLRRRLGQGRELLRRRLLARGLAPTAALAASLFAEGAASASVPVALVGATLRGVLQTAPLTPAVASLVQAGGALVSGSKVKLATVVLLVASLLGGAGVWACYGLPAAAPIPTEDPIAARADDKPRTVSPKRETVKSLEIQGWVRDPDGKPKAGAKLLLLGEREKPQPLGTTAADGRFTITVPKETTDRRLIAQAEGFGIDFVYLPQGDAKKPIELRLVKDRAIRGRVLNTEGKPVAGVRVAADSIHVYADNSLDSFLTAWKKRHFMSGIPYGRKQLWSGVGTLFATTTDAQGRFTLHGLGDERVISLRISRAGIADEEPWIVNRGGFDPKPYNQATLENIPKGQEHLTNRWLLHGPDLSLVAEAEKILRGVVQDTDTGKGRPKVLVQLTRREGGDLLRLPLKARTDAQGRYELRGAHKARRYMLEVGADTTAGYVPCQVWADDSAGYQPITVDIKVKKGVIVTGKMIDGAGGKAVRGHVMIAALHSNPFVKDFPSFDNSAWFPMQQTDARGIFRVVAIPGPMLLMGGPSDLKLRFQFKPAAPDPKYPQYFTKNPEFAAYYNHDGSISPIQGTSCKVLEIEPDAKIVEQDIVLERASVLPLQIQDTDGKPLSGVWVAGSSAEKWHYPIQCENASCSVYEVKPGKPRLLVFFHKERKLAASLTLKGDEKAPVVMKLGPAGAIKGQLLDAEGKPLAGVVIDLHYRERAASEIHNDVHRTRQIVTDAAGAFTVEDLIPDQKFELAFRHGKQKFERTPKQANSAIEVKAGECRGLGVIPVKHVSEKAGE